MGLTGGIGSGKSTVAEMLAERGAVVVDTDEIAREVVEPGGPAHAAVASRFGPGVLSAGGQIDRSALAAVVFSDQRALADLNAIVHPAVAEGVRNRLARLPADAVAVVVVPLLVETGWSADLVVVVDAPEDEAVARVVRQRDMAEPEVRRRMAAQASRAERRARADHVVDNRGSREDLRAEVDRLWERIRAARSQEA